MLTEPYFGKCPVVHLVQLQPGMLPARSGHNCTAWAQGVASGSDRMTRAGSELGHYRGVGAKLPAQEQRGPVVWRPGSELTPLEEEMVASAAAGELVDCGGGPFNLAAMQKWGPERTVSAAVLRHLLIGKDWNTAVYATIGRLGGLSDPGDRLSSTRYFLRELNRSGLTNTVDAGESATAHPQDYQAVAELAPRPGFPVRIS